MQPTQILPAAVYCNKRMHSAIVWETIEMSTTCQFMSKYGMSYGFAHLWRQPTSAAVAEMKATPVAVAVAKATTNWQLFWLASVRCCYRWLAHWLGCRFHRQFNFHRCIIFFVLSFDCFYIALVCVCACYCYCWFDCVLFFQVCWWFWWFLYWYNQCQWQLSRARAVRVKFNRAKIFWKII